MSVWAEQVRSGVYKVRWRGAWTTVNGERKRPEGAKTVHSREAVIELSAVIQRALDTTGWYEHRGPPEQRVADLEEIGRGWIEHKCARGIATGTRAVLRSALANVFRTVRGLRRGPASAPLLASLLTRELVTGALLAWDRRGLSEERRYDLARITFEMWRWASDDPTRWPGVPTPPRDASLVLPKPPVRRAPPPAPTFAEEDAILRRAKATGDPNLADVLAGMRLTGLRVGQVLGWRVADFDVTAATLRVTVGKSRNEKRNARTVPVPRELLRLLHHRLTTAANGNPRVFTSRSGGPLRDPADKVGRLWRDATAAKEVRAIVWEPIGRKARPTHAFRAGYLAALKRAGVEPEVRHALVGHTDATTEGRSYAGPEELIEWMRAAVDAHITPIDWAGPPPP